VRAEDAGEHPNRRTPPGSAQTITGSARTGTGPFGASNTGNLVMNTLVSSISLAMGGASPEGVSAARGFLYILAMLCLWALVFALRAVPRAVTILLRLMLVMLALAALGVACVAVIALVVLAIGPI
jgi:hypothetical protein